MEKAHAYFTREQRKAAKAEFKFFKKNNPVGYDQGRNKIMAKIADGFVRHCTFDARLSIIN